MVVHFLLSGFAPLGSAVFPRWVRSTERDFHRGRGRSCPLYNKQLIDFAANIYWLHVVFTFRKDT